MRELWKVVASFPDYKVSNCGRVMRAVADSQGKNLSKILKGWTANSGYVQVRLYRNGESSPVSVHRILCIAFHGKAPTTRHHASHKDGIRINNVSRNLRWRTPSENNMEKHKHGTVLTGANHPTRYMPSCVPRGSSHGNAKLTESAVVKIRKDTRTATAIAADYGVGMSMICKIKKRVFWRHVP